MINPKRRTIKMKSNQRSYPLGARKPVNRREPLRGKKVIASFELILMMVSLFAFSFLIGATIPVVDEVQDGDSAIKILLSGMFNRLKKPMVPVVSAQAVVSQPSYCCEKTSDGSYCINTDESNCVDNFKSAPSSCETTSYCRLGTCYESGEGICMANTPQRVCDANGGTWDAREINEVPQCQLGCCIIAEQAAFVPLVRCKRLSTLFGVENDYRMDVTSEIACIATAQSQDMGACVFEKEFERLCKFTTRGECGASQEVETVGGNISDGAIETTTEKKFYENYLCSAEELNTACAKQTSTGCYDGKVYEFDSCGNRENVYSSDKDASWNKGMVAEPGEVCAENDGSNKNCGNCEYLLGSRCAEWDGILGIGKPSGSDHYCQTTECVDRDGNKRLNGESWCVNDGQIGEGSDTVGSRYYKEVCVDGEVRVEPCADFRKEVCISGSIEIGSGSFGTAACRVNRWQTCAQITDEEDCTNIDKVDCMWLPSVTGMVFSVSADGGGQAFSNPTASGSGEAFGNPTASGDPSITGSVISPITGNALFGGGGDEETEETKTNRGGGICLPNFPPGLEFWEENTAKQMCGVANAKCTAIFEKGLIGGSWKCIENCECLEDDWAVSANQICVALGDCGGYINYQGEYSDEGYLWRFDGEEKEIKEEGIMEKIGQGFTGLVAAMTGLVAGGFGMITGMSEIGGASETVTVDAPSVEVAKDSAIGDALSDGGGGAGGVEKVAEGGVEKVVPGAITTATTSLVPIKGTSFLSKTFLTKKMTAATGGGGLMANAVLSGFQWGAIAYGAGQLIGPMIGLNKKNTNALSMAMGAGFFAYKTASIYNAAAVKAATIASTPGTTVAPATNLLTVNPALTGVVIGVVIFLVMYKKTETKTIEFNCMPWQAPTGGDVCEVCNDENLPCSEYRCRSLGQNCEIVNSGSDQERCVNVRPNDVDQPVIRPNDEKLTEGHKYTNVKNSPPGPGFTIINLNSSDGCLKAFTPLEFGVNTNEPAQCKIDFKHTLKFDDMAAYMGGSNFYAYNHSEQFALPGAEVLANASFILENGRDWLFYIRCKDTNGNANDAEYAVKFCIDPTPDSTAPEVKATSILNGGCVAEEQSNAEVEFYTNEPAECRWSKEDQDYDSMQNDMSCTNALFQMNALQLFTCRTVLTGVSRDETKFYIRCKDQPGKPDNDRNENQESYEFSLRGSTGLKMKNLQPNGTIFGAVNPAPVELYAETLFGCNDGQAVCFYATEDKNSEYIQFFDTNTIDGIHTQRLDLGAGQHKYYIKCVDEGGNVVKDTLNFKLDIDENAPVVARVYEEDDLLKLVTVRKSECVYTFDDCDFSFQEGTVMPYANSTVHVAEWNEEKTYYIKCRDEFRNEDADCSIIVRPSRNFL